MAFDAFSGQNSQNCCSVRDTSTKSAGVDSNPPHSGDITQSPLFFLIYKFSLAFDSNIQ